MSEHGEESSPPAIMHAEVGKHANTLQIEPVIKRKMKNIIEPCKNSRIV
jgi:hypothetical protein